MNFLDTKNLLVGSTQTRKLGFIFFMASIFLTSTIFAQIPTLEWAKGIGSSGTDFGNSITTDDNGNVFTTGCFSGTVDFDPGVGTMSLTSNGTKDIFIQKLDANGNFLWAKSIGGMTSDIAVSITTDPSGAVYIVGDFIGTFDFDPGIGIMNLTSNGSKDIFIQKLDTNGNFVWAKSFGGTGSDQAASVITDASGNVYTVGYFYSTVDFDPGIGTMNFTSNGFADAYIQKLDATGSFIWVKVMGSLDSDYVTSINIDGNGNIYTTGYFSDVVDFDPGAGVMDFTSIGSTDIFIQKLDGNGNFLWTKTMGSMNFDSGYSITTDPSGNVYTLGTFEDTVDFDLGVGVLDLTSNGSRDIFIQKLDANGNFLWANSIGSSATDYGSSIILDLQGNIYTTGYFNGTVDFDPGNGVMSLTTNGAVDAYIQKLDGNGNFLWADLIGSIGSDYGASITLDVSGDIYTTGHFEGGVDFDPGTGTVNLISNGDVDVFIQKLASGNCQPTASTDVQTACDTYTWIDGNTYTMSGVTATYIVPNAAGCDSIITLDLTINAVSTIGVTIIAATLTADLVAEAGISYNWLDCTNGFSPVGVTTQAYSPTVNGNYAVRLVEDECVDTSSCFVINNVGLEDNKLNSVSIVPNPTNNLVTIRFESSEAKLTILDLNGRVMDELTAKSGNQIDLSTYRNGVYLFTLFTDSMRITERVVKQ